MENEPYTIDTIVGKATIYSGKPTTKEDLLNNRIAELEGRLKRIGSILAGDLVFQYDEVMEMRELCDDF